MFEIILTDEIVPETDPGVVALYGKIYVGDFAETFITSLVSWNQKAYERHWASALRRLLEGASKSALITSYVEPGLADHLVWWPLYREGDTVYVQNHMLFYDQLGKPFSSGDPWRSVPQRRTVNPEGQRISEWETDLSSIQKCLSGWRPLTR
jgi:hypothetical protein